MPSGESGAPDSGARQLLTDYIGRSAALPDAAHNGLFPIQSALIRALA